MVGEAASDPEIIAQPWERKQGERNLWFDRFTRYRLMGPKRSLLGAVNAERRGAQRGATKSVPRTWADAFLREQWKARAEAFDQAERDRMEDEWEERRSEVRERDYIQARELRDLAQQIIDAAPQFIHEREYRRGDKTFVIKALDGHLAVKALEASSKLQRLAAEIQDPVQKVDVTSDGKAITIREVIVELPKGGENE